MSLDMATLSFITCAKRLAFALIRLLDYGEIEFVPQGKFSTVNPIPEGFKKMSGLKKMNRTQQSTPMQCHRHKFRPGFKL